MLRPIKRVWVPPKPAPTLPAVAAAPPARIPAAPRQVFGVLPETEVEERDTDSVWAEFDDVYAKAKASNNTNNDTNTDKASSA
jgi:hypothetical protein